MRIAAWIKALQHSGSVRVAIATKQATMGCYDGFYEGA